MELTGPNDRPIILTLTSSVRLFSVDQIARTWWGENKHPRKSANRRLRELERAGLIARETVHAAPLLELEAPLLQWSPGEPDPTNLPELEHQLSERWTEPPVLTPVVYATKEAATLWGGFQPGRIAHQAEATHDLHVSELYLRLRRDHPELVESWRSEEELPPLDRQVGGYMPDAALVGPDGGISLYIEFAGRYKVERLEKIHIFCKAKGYPYDLW